MRIINYALFAILMLAGLPLAAQAPTFDEMEFEMDSLSTSYKPSGKNYVLIRSKRGNSGLNKTAQADAVLSAEITEIVLVYTETEAADLAEREEANRERWENLLMTYPDLFQFSTTYKNVCQCRMGGNAEALKQSQGFYVYVNGEVPAAAPEPVKEEPKPVAVAPKAESKTPAAETKTEPKTEPKAAEKKVAEEKKVVEQQAAVADNTAVKTPEPPAAKREEVKKEEVKEAPREETPAEPVVKKAAPQKKATAAAKPRRAKDPKACRIACYEGGDESLDVFFKDNIQLTKKQRRKIKKSTALLRLQLNVDGSIKKVMVTGADEKFNVMVTGAANAMNKWNPTVKSGVTVKSEVKITLKYDKATKAVKPADVTVTPKLAPKCKCVSDSELFD